ncbi:hypothetical protein CRENBAI_011375, partial [Crenichthys baileyi]
MAPRCRRRAQLENVRIAGIKELLLLVKTENSKRCASLRSASYKDEAEGDGHCLHGDSTISLFQRCGTIDYFQLQKLAAGREKMAEEAYLSAVNFKLCMDFLMCRITRVAACVHMQSMGTAEPPAVPAIMSNSCFRGYRTISQHLNDLKKENFSLKLRIYFLEEKIQQKFEESSDDVHKR